MIYDVRTLFQIIIYDIIMMPHDIKYDFRTLRPEIIYDIIMMQHDIIYDFVEGASKCHN